MPFLELEPEPFRYPLLYPPDLYGGGVDALDGGGLLGGEESGIPSRHRTLRGSRAINRIAPGHRRPRVTVAWTQPVVP
jgi:hypothetical protein